MTRLSNHHLSKNFFYLFPILILIFPLPNPTSPTAIRVSRSAGNEEQVTFTIAVEVKEDATKDATESSPYQLTSIINAIITDANGFEKNDDLNFTVIDIIPNVTSKHFKLRKTDRQEARINVILPLDREELKEKHPDIVKVKQSSGEVTEIEIFIKVSSLNAEQTIIYNVFVLDSNDNAPKFKEETLRKTLDENREPREENPLMQVVAVDADWGKNGEISFQRGKVTSFNFDGVEDIKSNPGQWFNISANGQVNVKRSFDYEKTVKFTIVVVASDQGKNPNKATSTVTINIKDVNEPPECEEKLCQVG